MNRKLTLKRVLITFFGSAGFAFLTIGLIIHFSGRKPAMGGDFTVTYRDQPWSLHNNSKPITALYIGYTKCPDVCPLSLSFAAQAFKRLNKDELKDIQLVFLSVDQEHDLPNDVADYAAQFFKEFIGLSGTNEQIDKTVNIIGASYMIEKYPKSYLGYSITHSDRLFFLNKKGFVIDSIPSPRSADVIYTKIMELL